MNKHDPSRRFILRIDFWPDENGEEATPKDIHCKEMPGQEKIFRMLADVCANPENGPADVRSWEVLEEVRERGSCCVKIAQRMDGRVSRDWDWLWRA